MQDPTGRLVIAKEQRKEADYLKVVTTPNASGISAEERCALQRQRDPGGVLRYAFRIPYTHNTWLVVTTVVTDPQYLIEPLITHAHFKKIPDASGWDPTPCRANEPR